jgi:hypothetical protein
MSPLETLFRLEIDYHRRLRALAPFVPDAGSLHTSYALRFRYEVLLNSLGPVTAHDVDALRERLTLAGDARDILAARNSLKQVLGLSPVDA